MFLQINLARNWLNISRYSVTLVSQKQCHWMESALKPVLTNLEKIQKADTYKSEDKEYQNIGNKAGKYVESI